MTKKKSATEQTANFYIFVDQYTHTRHGHVDLTMAFYKAAHDTGVNAQKDVVKQINSLAVEGFGFKLELKEASTNTILYAAFGKHDKKWPEFHKALLNEMNEAIQNDAKRAGLYAVEREKGITYTPRLMHPKKD